MKTLNHHSTTPETKSTRLERVLLIIESARKKQVEPEENRLRNLENGQRFMDESFTPESIKPVLKAINAQYQSLVEMALETPDSFTGCFMRLLESYSTNPVAIGCLIKAQCLCALHGLSPSKVAKYIEVSQIDRALIPVVLLSEVEHLAGKPQSLVSFTRGDV